MISIKHPVKFLLLWMAWHRNMRIQAAPPGFDWIEAKPKKEPRIISVIWEARLIMSTKYELNQSSSPKWYGLFFKKIGEGCGGEFKRVILDDN